MKLRLAFALGLGLAVLSFAAVSHSATIYYGTLSGDNESPPSGSLGTGFARVTVDLDLMTMRVEAEFSGLGSNSTNAHIHCCLVDGGPLNVGVATMVPTFTGFPSGVTAGTYDMTFDLTMASTFNPTFVTANGGTAATAAAALIAGLDTGHTYFNVHSVNFAGGEIRAPLSPVPEPQSLLVVALGLGVAAALRRRRL